MSTIRRGNIVRRNDRCVCGSGKKFKHCCSPDAFKHHRTTFMPPAPQSHIDFGEEPIRWVIVDRTGTQFFSDKDNRVLVFADKESATAVIQIDEFSDQESGEINIGGVGPTKWAKFQEMLPFVEVQAEEGIALVRERIRVGREAAEKEDAAPEGEPQS
jgi:hypothetical protein